LIEQGNSLTSGQSNALKELSTMTEDLTKDRDTLHTQLT